MHTLSIKQQHHFELQLSVIFINNESVLLCFGQLRNKGGFCGMSINPAPPVYVLELSLSRTLNSKLSCMALLPLVCECVYEWVNVRQITV